MSICKESTYKSLYTQYSEYLRNFLYYKSGNMNLSEDICQEAFIKLWESCGKVTTEKAKSFLFTVANNLFLNQMKHKKIIIEYSRKRQQHTQVQDPHFLLVEDEFRIRLKRAISDLPEEEREVFLMNRIDKMKYREIAEYLGISQKAVEKRMSKALNKLRKVHQKI